MILVDRAKGGVTIVGMEQHRQFKVVGEREKLRKLISLIDQKLQSPWKRVPADPIDARLDQLQYAYIHRTPLNDQSARLFLGEFPLTEGLYQLAVTNVVPVGRNLTMAESNSSIDFFVTIYAEPLLPSLGLGAAISKKDMSVADYAGEACESLLRAFSDSANKSTPHPFDQERFRQFIICVHESGRALPSDVMERYLTASHWAPSRAAELATEFEHGLDLLRQYCSTKG